MRVVIPVYKNRVAPRFSFAQSVIIGEIENNSLIITKEIMIVADSYSGKIAQFKGLGIDCIICSGISNDFLKLILASGISVLPNIIGDALDILSKFSNNQLNLKNTLHGIKKAD